MSYTQLFYDSTNFFTLEDGVNPHFLCPMCKYVWQPKLSFGTNFPTIFDFNQKASFTIPNHIDPKTGKHCVAADKTIELFVTVHKDENGTVLCIQRSDSEGASGIPANWWQRTA